MVNFDTNVLPPLGVAGLEAAFKLDQMQVGQSFFHECDKGFAVKLGSAVRTYSKRTNSRFITKRLDAGAEYGNRKIENGGIAVWRTA